METSLITVVSKVISLTPHFRESPQTKALGRILGKENRARWSNARRITDD